MEKEGRRREGSSVLCLIGGKKKGKRKKSRSMHRRGEGARNVAKKTVPPSNGERKSGTYFK